MAHEDAGYKTTVHTYILLHNLKPDEKMAENVQ
jgi:hypothetical protein